jgi:hypothetical protein
MPPQSVSSARETRGTETAASTVLKDEEAVLSGGEASGEIDLITLLRTRTELSQAMITVTQEQEAV